MEIIFRGKTPAENTYTVSCYNCKSIIRYKGSEIVQTHYDQREGTSHTLGDCPVCGVALYNYSPKEEV